MTASSSSGVTRTSRGFDPSEGPTMPRVSRMSISRPAFANPTELALQHRGRAELQGDHQLHSLKCQLQIVADVLSHLGRGVRSQRHILAIWASCPHTWLTTARTRSR